MINYIFCFVFQTDDENTTSGADEALELAMKSVQVA